MDSLHIKAFNRDLTMKNDSCYWPYDLCPQNGNRIKTPRQKSPRKKSPRKNPFECR